MGPHLEYLSNKDSNVCLQRFYRKNKDRNYDKSLLNGQAGSPYPASFLPISDSDFD